MKILYSQLKQFIPDLKAAPQEIGQALTMIGFLQDSFEEVKYQGQKDTLLGFEVRQNRGDCLSVIGLGREVAAYFNHRLNLPEVADLKVTANENLDIKVESPEAVKRIMAVRINNLKNQPSPDWLKKYLEFYDINSVNFLVDLSNYAMLLTGYPSHLIDADKLQGNLIWSKNNQVKKFISLDRTEFQLIGDDELVIKDSKKIIALAGLIGGQAAAIGMDTTDIIAETAIYDQAIVRKNSRNLKIFTEAGNRLGKLLDPNGLNYNLKLLVSLIQEHCGGQVRTNIFDYYPLPYCPVSINLDPKLPSVYSGIKISKAEKISILRNLRFKIKDKGNLLNVTPPLDRVDISDDADVVEEVIRIYGFEKIPVGQVPNLAVVKKITPPVIELEEKIRDILVSLGYDEIMSLPLVAEGTNKEVNYLDWKSISTQNSVNWEYPDLRQSLASGLINQTQIYEKKNLEFIRLFETGKVFGKVGNDFQEHEALGVLLSGSGSINDLKIVLENILRLLGITKIDYADAKIKPEISNPYSCWDIKVENKIIGILYKFRPDILDLSAQAVKNTYFAEINLEKLADLLEQTNAANKVSYNSVVELKGKLVTLDSNIELASEKNSDSKIKKYLADLCDKIGENNIWDIRIVDRFEVKDKIRYTIRVSYIGLTDQEAKELHMKVLR